MPPARGKYKEGETVLCYQGLLIYEAKIQGIFEAENSFLLCNAQVFIMAFFEQGSGLKKLGKLKHLRTKFNLLKQG